MNYYELMVTLSLSAVIALIVSIAFHYLTTLTIKSWFERFFSTQHQLNKQFVETIKEDIRKNYTVGKQTSQR